MSKIKPVCSDQTVQPALRADSRERSDHSLVSWRPVQAVRAPQRLHVRRFSPHQREGAFKDRDDGAGTGERRHREDPAAMVTDMMALLARRFMVRIVVMDVQDD